MSATITEPVAEPTTDAPQTGETPAAEPFDRERAMATIEKLREYEKRAKQLEREAKERDQAEQAARDKALADQQQFKELADKRADRIVELETKASAIETLQQERDRLANVVDAYAKQRREGLPAHIIELLDDKDAVAQLDWLNKHPELFADAGRPTAGITAAPKPAGNLSKDELYRRELDAQRERMR